MNALLTYARDLLAKSPARAIAYGSAAIVAGVLKVASLLGVALTPEVIASVGVVATFVVTEAIRRFVYSPNTVAVIAAGAPTSAVDQTPDEFLGQGTPLDGPTV